MKLYHGTNRDFEKIDLQKSKPNKDFGRGFYLSADYEQALSMAQVKVAHPTNPVEGCADANPKTMLPNDT